MFHADTAGLKNVVATMQKYARAIMANAGKRRRCLQNSLKKAKTFN